MLTWWQNFGWGKGINHTWTFCHQIQRFHLWSAIHFTAYCFINIFSMVLLLLLPSLYDSRGSASELRRNVSRFCKNSRTKKACEKNIPLLPSCFYASSSPAIDPPSLPRSQLRGDTRFVQHIGWWWGQRQIAERQKCKTHLQTGKELSKQRTAEWAMRY